MYQHIINSKTQPSSRPSHHVLIMHAPKLQPPVFLFHLQIKDLLQNQKLFKAHWKHHLHQLFKPHLLKPQSQNHPLLKQNNHHSHLNSKLLPLPALPLLTTLLMDHLQLNRFQHILSRPLILNPQQLHLKPLSFRHQSQSHQLNPQLPTPHPQ